MPPISPATVAEITLDEARLEGNGPGRYRVVAPGVAAALYIHEDHYGYVWRGGGSLSPLTVRIYAQDLGRLDEPGQVRVLGLRSSERQILDPLRAAAGRDVAEPVLLTIIWLACGTIIACLGVGLWRLRGK